MAIAELIARFWVSVAMLAAITLLSTYFIVYVLRSKTSSCPKTWTEKERIRISADSIEAQLAASQVAIDRLGFVVPAPLRPL